jgi:hypothetical protein
LLLALLLLLSLLLSPFVVGAAWGAWPLLALLLLICCQ